MIINNSRPKIQETESWIDSLNNSLEFISANPFTISSPKMWDGKIEYLGVAGWREWNGEEISSVGIAKYQCIYLRGTKNTKVTGGVGDSFAWVIDGTAVECNRNIEFLLDYKKVKAGEHPAMAASCYGSMFNGCTALTKVPKLSATALAGSCYDSMFKGCTALTEAPELPATALSSGCYGSMFSGCTALTKAPKLPAMKLAGSCYSSMFANCTALTEAPELPATALSSNCYFSMFSGCTSLTSIPKLPATTLVASCYQYMFLACSKIKLSTAKTGTYTKEYRIPVTGNGKTDTSALELMFYYTGGTFSGTPSINTTYYLDKSNTIV